MNKPMYIKEIESIINNKKQKRKQKTPGSDVFTSEFYQTRGG